MLGTGALGVLAGARRGTEQARGSESRQIVAEAKDADAPAGDPWLVTVGRGGDAAPQERLRVGGPGGYAGEAVHGKESHAEGVRVVLVVSAGVVVIVAAAAVVPVVPIVAVSRRGRQERAAQRRREAWRHADEARERAARPERDIARDGAHEVGGDRWMRDA
jgi:hypothetical protein